MAVILSGARSAESKDLLFLCPGPFSNLCFQIAMDPAVILTSEGRKNLSDVSGPASLGFSAQNGGVTG
jgi:hypothetical protein